jgi:RNA polymerase sigma factor (sigma-70 family)
LFRAGHEEAFRAIHDRYRQRLFAYTRQMLPRRQDAEDALQDVFVRAYGGLRANDRDLALRAWLYRVAHNRCIDELRRRPDPLPELLELIHRPIDDPVAAADRRESLRRLIADVRRLPDQQRSALLMRELSGMPYAEMATALGVSVAAVKSLLVRARISLVQAVEARDTACSEIREELSASHDRGVRPPAMARRHLRDCAGCREFRGQLRGVSHQLSAMGPGLGPAGVLAKLLGLGGGASGGAAAGGGTAAGTGGVATCSGALATGAGHVATLIAATVVTAGGAVEIQHTITTPQHRHQVPIQVTRRPTSTSPPLTTTAPPQYATDPRRAAPPAATSAPVAARSLAATPASPPSVTKPAATADRAGTSSASSSAPSTTDTITDPKRTGGPTSSSGSQASPPSTAATSPQGSDLGSTPAGSAASSAGASASTGAGPSSTSIVAVQGSGTSSTTTAVPPGVQPSAGTGSAGASASPDTTS